MPTQRVLTPGWYGTAVTWPFRGRTRGPRTFAFAIPRRYVLLPARDSRLRPAAIRSLPWPDRMFRLNVLGQIELRDPTGADVRSVLAQPKRLALLVYLAMARPRGFHRRDALMALFWPELSEDRARNALRQALHQLRQSLGAGVVLARGAESIAVDRARIECDAAAFDDALDRGLLADAVGHYAGELLPSFSAEGADGFNAWLDESRTRLRQRAARAGWALAEQHERAGMSSAAAACARRAAELTTDDEAAIRQLISLLDRVGDAAGAVRAYEDFVIRLRRELALDPSPDTRALADAIRGRGGEFAESSGALSTPRVPRPDDSRVAHASRHRSLHGRRTTVWIEAFENLTGDDSFDFVGRLAATGVAQGLTETRLVDVLMIDQSVGAQLRADADRMLVAGSYHLVDDVWNLSASLRTASGGRTVASISNVVARRERPWEAAQELSRRLSGAVAGHLDPRVASWAGVVTEPPNLDAHRTHLLGMEMHLRGQYRTAIAHFLRAANVDSGFTVPMLWAIQASCNLEEFEQASAIQEELVAHRARLSPAEQLGCDYFGALLAGDRGSALRLVRRVSELVPDSEVLTQLGRAALLFNQPRYAVEVLERLDPEAGWTPSWTPYWRRLTEAYHLLGDHQRESAAARRGRLQHPESIAALLYDARAHAALGDVDAARRTADEAVSLAPDPFATAGDVLFAAAKELNAHGNPAAGAVLLDRAIDWQRDHCAAEHRSYAVQMTLARMLYDAAHIVEAYEILAETQRVRADDVDLIGFIGAIAAREGHVARAQSAISTLRGKTGRFHFGKHLLWSARIAAILGDEVAASASLRGAFARGCSYDIELHTDIDLALLAEHQWFRELLRPKG